MSVNVKYYTYKPITDIVGSIRVFCKLQKWLPQEIKVTSRLPRVVGSPRFPPL